MSEAPHPIRQLMEQLALRPDVSRALRETIALGVPLMVCHALGRPSDAPYVAMATQTIALHDLRGAYAMRLAIAATMTLIVAASALLGVLAGGSVVTATATMGLMALLGACWRHLSSDYGAPLGVSSALLFLIGLSAPGGLAAALHTAELVMIGGAGATLLHVGFWVFRPQHPLRSAVAETWMAVSDLAASMRPDSGEPSRNEGTASRERELRAALDRTFAILHAAESRQRAAFILHLEEMRREVVHLAMRLIALNTSIEALTDQSKFTSMISTVDSMLEALSNAARSVAVILVTHRVENLALSKVRLRRCRDFAQVLDEQLVRADVNDTSVANVRAALAQVVQVLPRIKAGMNETVSHAEVRFSFPPRLADFNPPSIHSLAAWINPPKQLNPVLTRYAVRMTVLTMLAVALYKGFAIPRGYWIALTIMVVLQPDYGSTRTRAAERIGGTLAGGLLASAILWVKMPLFLIDGFAALMCFGFAYYLKRRYSVAVFFVTLMVVLITETMAPVHLDFTVWRLFSTLLGGGVALIAALVFWPSWEREKFPTLLVAAIRANRTYLESMSKALGISAVDNADPLTAKRRAENANRFAAASLQRMLGEPSGRAGNTESAAALVTYNQRVTRALTALTVHLEESKPVANNLISSVVPSISRTLETLAQTIEEKPDAASELINRLGELGSLISEINTATNQQRNQGLTFDAIVLTQLLKTIAEVKAMALALNLPNTRTSPPMPAAAAAS